ncbi:hypothetical protein [Paenibacillus roseipurpureus]|uniref:Uncharacterized protein n=1 Tax=Paenibacillus roseopurpureus TaxID=2918901 RepID=A0AA96LV10_9BACL|nr:hypothetical protein [Paenibacillus sp. MBLB1832]WNR45145.1 hypothetical protein MJB10_03050 [Paenibacillus sp. MBLB1832]
MTYVVFVILVVIVLAILNFAYMYSRKHRKVNKSGIVEQNYFENPTNTLLEEAVLSLKEDGTQASQPQIIEDAIFSSTIHKKNKTESISKKFKHQKKVTQSKTPSAKVDLYTKKNLRKMAVIWKKPTDINTCYRCDGGLESELVYVATSPSVYSKGKDLKYIEVKVLTCTTCRYVCADENMILKMKQISKGYIDIRTWGQGEIKSNKGVKQEPTSQPLNNNFNWPSTFAIETIKPVSIADGFEKESGLHRLGYKISGISRQRRWWILENEALPKLGLQQVANTIAANVRARKRQKGGKQKYAYAIVEWEHDLAEMKKHYYRRDFTWPHID